MDVGICECNERKRDGVEKKILDFTTTENSGLSSHALIRQSLNQRFRPGGV